MSWDFYRMPPQAENTKDSACLRDLGHAPGILMRTLTSGDGIEGDWLARAREPSAALGSEPHSAAQRAATIRVYAAVSIGRRRSKACVGRLIDVRWSRGACALLQASAMEQIVSGGEVKMIGLR